MGQRRSRYDGRVGDLHMVMQLIALFQPAQDSDGIFNRWLGNEHFLEASLQGCIFLNILTVLIQRGCADAVQLTAGESRFQHVPGVHCAIGLTSAHHRVQLVNKQNNVAFLL